MSQLIDSHCHLDFDYAPKKAEDLVREANDAGVTTLITIGTDRKSSENLPSVSEKFKSVFHTIGVHPHDAKDMKDEDLDFFKKASSHEKCVAIGEIGLDYYYDHSPSEIQIKRLNEQLDLANEIDLPVVIHSRDAESDLLPALTRYAKERKSSTPLGVIHCFTGTREFGKACIDLGFYISFSGILTFKKSHDLRESAASFPLDHLLVETDSPYLAPVPYRGKKCEPFMVRETAKVLSQIKMVDFEETADQTRKNTQTLFQLST